jgi:hypothetical protein
MKVLISVMFCAFSVSAVGLPLQPITDPPKELLPIDNSAPNVPCDQILNALMKFKDMNRRHEDSVIAFLTQAVDKISGWYDVLSPLEGQQKNLEVGTFDPIRTGAENMSMVVDYSYDNTALLAQELDRIIVSMRECNSSSRKEK